MRSAIVKSSVACLSVAVASLLTYTRRADSAERPIGVRIRESIIAHRTALSELSVHWTRLHDVYPTTGTPVFTTDVHMAIKGEKRYFERTLTHVAGGQLPLDALHNGMSFDGNETHVLLFASHVRLWPGNMMKEYLAPDEFLGIQGYPTSDFFIWIPQDERKAEANLQTIINGSDYQVGQVSPDDPNSLVTITGPQDTLYLDPQMAFALVRRDSFSKATTKLIRRFTCDDWTKVAETVWLAKQIVDEIYDGDSLQYRAHLQVITLDTTNVSDALFKLTIPAGAGVADMRRTTPDANGTQPFLSYVFPTDPERLGDVIAMAQAEMEQQDIQYARGGRIRWILLIVNVAAIASVTGFVLYRRARRIGS